jgi:TRAP-type C4-dicarboxylate transport system substrate-binding protein
MNDDGFNKTVQSWIEKAGLKLVLWETISFKKLGSNVKINTIDDFKHFNTRTQTNPYHIEFWRSVGANPTSIVSTELYLALQQSLVSGNETNLSGMLSYKFPEVLKYMYKSNFLPHMACVVMNLNTYNLMTPEDRAWFDDFCAEMRKKFNEISLKMENDGWDTMAKLYKTQVEEVDSQLLKNLKEVAEKAEWVMVRKNLGDKVVDQYLQAIEKYDSK